LATELRAVREGSKYATMLTMADAGRTVSDIAKAIGQDEKETKWRFHYPLRQDHGIDYKIAESGAVSLVLPKGKTLEDCIVARKS
jgi:hypothetical protein